MKPTIKTHRSVVVAALVVVAAVVLVPVPAAAETATFDVDGAHSSVAFSVRHFVTQVPGRFNEVSGTIVYDAEKPESSSVEVTVQAASIDTNNDDRDAHLRSPDFFDVEQFPTLSFKSVKVEAGAGDELQVTGDLTIHGTTRTVTVPVKVLGVMGDKAGFATSFSVDRKDYGVNWNRVLDQGGAILGDEVDIDIDVEANEQKEEEAR